MKLFQRLSVVQRLVRKYKFWRQRRTRGFDDSDTWSLDITIADFIRPRLEAFRDIQGHPQKFIDELNQMIEAFKLVEKGDSMTLPEDSEDYKTIVKGLKLFRKRYFKLWW